MCLPFLYPLSTLFFVRALRALRAFTFLRALRAFTLLSVSNFWRALCAFTFFMKCGTTHNQQAGISKNAVE